MKFWIPLALGCVVLFQGVAQAPLKLKIGDSVAISAPSGYGGSFEILSDGAIYGRGFGRVSLAGKTWEEAQAAIRKALASVVKERDVTVTIASQRAELVYIVGLAGGKGPLSFKEGLTLRQALSGSGFNEDADKVEVSIFRSGKTAFKAVAANLLNGSSADPALQPDDVVSLSPAEQMRVWVSGAVRNPGESKVPAGSDLYRAITAAGGLISRDAIDDEAIVILRRGPKTTEYKARQISTLERIQIEPGDDISVVLPEAARVTVAGFVSGPGEFLMNAGATVSKAIARAGGATTKGTLQDVLIVRGTDTYQVDVTKPETDFKLITGDLVVVRRNEKALFVLGEVSGPGRFEMEDGRTYRLADAVSIAGGLNGQGTYRRIYLARPDATGKVQITQFNLDEYLKDGKLESNPVLKPGDSVLVGRPNGLSLNAAGQILSSFILIDSLTNRR